MADLSADAMSVLRTLFIAGDKSTVKSHPPHATVARHAAVFQELIDGGFITEEPFNNFDVWLYRGTSKIAALKDTPNGQ